MSMDRKIYDFFISHSSDDNDHAKALYSLLKKINSDWEVFLDCGPEKPLEQEKEWCSKMLEDAKYSRHLIFIASSPNYLKEGYGRLYDEVWTFHDRKSGRFRHNRADLNISYFGILFGKWDFEKDLFSDVDRGSEYQRLYSSPEHLVLDADETINDAAERIKNKVLNAVGEAPNKTACELLDKTRNFAALRGQTDLMFNSSSIVDELIPELTEGDKTFNFKDICKTAAETDIAILGHEGGSGKTTMMTKLFFNFLSQAEKGIKDGVFIPIYIEAKSLSADNFLVFRYIARNLYGEYTAMELNSQRTSEIIGMLEKEFSLDKSEPRYLLLIDGYNEIPSESLNVFNKELKDFLRGGRYKNARVVLSGRTLDESLSKDALYTFSLSELKEIVVFDYLKSNSLLQVKPGKSLLKILSIPMYLAMYVDVAINDRIHNKGELLMRFVDRQLEKDAQVAVNDKQSSLYRLLLQYVLPFIANRMIMSDSTAHNFEITHEEMRDVLEAASSLMAGKDYKKYYGSDYRNDLRISGFSEYDEWDLEDLASKYFVDICKLLRRKDNEKYEFIHQIYRDFFCALFLAEDIKRSINLQTKCNSLTVSLPDRDIKEFTDEILKESRPYYDEAAEKWNYSCNESSHLILLLNSSRQTGQNQDPLFVSNIIDLLKGARRNDLSGCDFSELNLTKSDLFSCTFYRFDKNNIYPTSFKNSQINRENLLCQDHFSSICAVCTNKNEIASMDDIGIIKFWKKEKGIKVPHKIITNVGFAVQKMLYSLDNECIYALTAHEILEITIPEEFSSVAHPQILYKTTQRLRDMFLYENGEIYFTTVSNSFNPKPISNPDAPDNIGFYGFNSAAAVNSDKNQVAFGHVVGYNGLKVYNYSEEKNDWLDQKFGYAQLLHEYIIELEEAIRKLDLRKHFYNQAEMKNFKREAFRCKYFYNLEALFLDRVHYYDETPNKIVKFVLNELKQKKVVADKEQKNVLWEIAARYKKFIAELEVQNRPLLYTTGRKVSSIEYKPGTNILLMSYYNDYDAPGGLHNYHTTVMELDTSNYSSRIVYIYSGLSRLQAMYCGEDIVIFSGNRIIVHTGDGSIIELSVRYKGIGGFFKAEGEDTFYLVNKHFVYEFDRNLRCKNSMYNMLNNLNLIYCSDENGNKYLVKNYEASNKGLISVLDLSTGHCRRVDLSDMKFSKKKTLADFYNRTFKNCVDKIVSFDDGVKSDELDIQYRLFVCNCDFTGVTGSLANSHDLSLLTRYGALTGLDYISEEQNKEEFDYSFVSSDSVFEESETVKQTVSPFVYEPGLKFVPCYWDEKYKQLFLAESWAFINLGGIYIQGGLDASDYSVLEWINQLGFVTSAMVFQLMEAGVIEKPRNYVYSKDRVSKRMAKTLYQNYKLLLRYSLEERNRVVYRLSPLFGDPLLKKTIGEREKETNISQLYQKRSAQEIGRMLSINQWFCLTLCRYKGWVERYAVNIGFDTENHANGRAKISGYIKLGKQAFFAEAYRGVLSAGMVLSVREKIGRLCILAENFRSLTSNAAPEVLTQAPVIVMIGESFEHCKQLSEAVCDIAPHIRKLFTYDVLVYSEEEALGAGCYFEFVDSEPRAVNLRDLI